MSGSSCICRNAIGIGCGPGMNWQCCSFYHKQGDLPVFFWEMQACRTLNFVVYIVIIWLLISSASQGMHDPNSAIHSNRKCVCHANCIETNGLLSFTRLVKRKITDVVQLDSPGCSCLLLLRQRNLAS